MCFLKTMRAHPICHLEKKTFPTKRSYPPTRSLAYGSAAILTSPHSSKSSFAMRHTTSFCFRHTAPNPTLPALRETPSVKPQRAGAHWLWVLPQRRNRLKDWLVRSISFPSTNRFCGNTRTKKCAHTAACRNCFRKYQKENAGCCM